MIHTLIRRIATLTLLLAIVLPMSAQRRVPFKVMFWNTENLFDTVHDEGKNDTDFTPEGKMHWNNHRLYRKMDNMARVIAAAGDSLPPDIIGMCEVENDSVMTALTKRSTLATLGYRYIMTESADRRGIDVALLYQRERFKPIATERIRPENLLTRDILHVCGLTLSGDTLDVIVAHLPSRRSGKESEAARMKVAGCIKNASDSLMEERQRPHIIIMGDFNDYPTDRSISAGICAAKPTATPDARKLYHLFLDKEHRKRGRGSYKYQGEWGYLDHIIVSGLLLDSSESMHTSPEHSGELRLPMLLTEDTKCGGTKPLRTYIGPSYNGGVSDHLPVYADFTLCLPF
jgi:predicted extracellular nuclease